VIEAGGEGVVIRDADGRCWRAKPRTTIDRVCAKTYIKPDHTGQDRRFADLAVVLQSGRLRSLQCCLVPECMEPRRGDVLVVVGASVSETGVVRHARIVDTDAGGETIDVSALLRGAVEQINEALYYQGHCPKCGREGRVARDLLVSVMAKCECGWCWQIPPVGRLIKAP
jgi:hypothetical protein